MLTAPPPPPPLPPRARPVWFSVVVVFPSPLDQPFHPPIISHLSRRTYANGRFGKDDCTSGSHPPHVSRQPMREG